MNILTNEFLMNVNRFSILSTKGEIKDSSPVLFNEASFMDIEKNRAS